MSDDSHLLHRYAKEGSEEAFSQLLTRYLDLVYSTALRKVGGDTGLAQDVSQAVFVALAKKARWFPFRVVLGGWLYRCACLEAAHAVRTESRRHARERAASEMNLINDHDEHAWEKLAPFLDEAMEQLHSRDREAVVLRYFEGRDHHAVGAALGITEDAARMRVARALERLRACFKRRGLSLSGATLASLLVSHAVSAAPAGLAVKLGGPALAAAAAGGSSFLTFLKIMTMTKIKLSVVTLVALAGLATSLGIEHHAAAKLNAENAALRALGYQIERLRAENERMAGLQANASEMERLRVDHLDLLRLRAEVTRLRQSQGDIARLETENRQLRAVRGNQAGSVSSVASVAYEIEQAKNNCIENLRQIDGAKEQWAMVTRQSDGVQVDLKAVNSLLFHSQTPTCPAGGVYSYGATGMRPTCSMGAALGHTL